MQEHSRTWHRADVRPLGTQARAARARLRQIIADMLSQVNYGNLTVCFSEERQMVSLGQRGRRYSGYKAEFAIDSFDRHIAEGVNPGSVGRSLFGLPGWLRDVARSGLPNCYVLDMANAHPAIQNRRYGHLRALREYVENREKVLASVPADRDSSKLLFIRMIWPLGGMVSRA